MARIEHCKGWRKAEAFWLYPRDSEFQYEILLKAACPRCKLQIMEWYGLLVEGEPTPLKRIHQKEQASWEIRIHTDLAFKVAPGSKDLRETRAIPIVGDYTKLLSLPVEQSYLKILARA